MASNEIEGPSVPFQTVVDSVNVMIPAFIAALVFGLIHSDEDLRIFRFSG